MDQMKWSQEKQFVGGMHVLLVNDSKFELNYLKGLLQKRGYDNLSQAYSATEALHKLERGSTEEETVKPDIILMNLIMPHMDGIEACSRIKSIEEYRDIPIIIITSADRDEQIQKAFDAGATDFVSIPIREVELIARMETALRLKHEMDQRKAREQELIRVMRQLDEANKRLKEISIIDGLTGVYNRRYFEETLKKEWNRSIRYQHSLSLILLDIDHFKRYNDHYGHYLGDDCLQKVAKVLKDSIHRSCHTVCRYGGEEFVVILPETDANGVFAVAQKLLQNVYQLRIPHEKSDTSPFVTISVGCCTMVPPCGMNQGQIITKADEALYLAKRQGRNRVCMLDVTQEIGM